METQIINNPNNEDQLNVKELMLTIIKWGRILRKKLWVLIIGAFIGSILGFTSAYFKPIDYNAKISFILEDGKSSGGGLSSIAGQIGIDLGQISGSNNILAGDNIIGLIKSRRLVEEALLTEHSNNFSLADRYADVYQMRKDWQSSGEIEKSVLFPPTQNRSGYTRLQDSLFKIVLESILKNNLEVERSDKKMTFFEVKVNMIDEELAKSFSERLVQKAINFYVETKTRRQRANVDRLQKRSDSIARLLNNQTYTAAYAQSQNLDINPAYQPATVRAELSNRDKLMIGTIYGELLKHLEAQKVSLTQESPVIEIVDPAKFPLNRTGRGIIKRTFLGFFISIFFFAFILIIAHKIKRLKFENKAAEL